MEKMDPVYQREPFETFVELLNSSRPMPGGGTAAGFCGAMGAALAGMAARMAVGKPKFAAVEKDLHRLISRTEELQKSLMAMAQEDAAMYARVLEAYKLPKGDPEQALLRDTAVEEASRAAVKASLSMGETCLEVLELAYMVVTKGSRMLVTDGSAAAILVRACQRVAAYNVRINLKAVCDEVFVADVLCQLEQQLQQGRVLEEAVLRETEARI